MYHKIEERSDWRHSSMQLQCLPSCNYGNGSVSWEVNVSYTADFFEPYHSKYRVLEATKQMFVQRNDSSIHPYQTEKWQLSPWPTNLACISDRCLAHYAWFPHGRSQFCRDYEMAEQVEAQVKLYKSHRRVFSANSWYLLFKYVHKTHSWVPTHVCGT